MRTSVLHTNRSGSKLLTWHLMHNGCQFAHCLMYITGAKFEENCFNISENILCLGFA